ncbi:zinc fingers and homeoboxes protein 2a [Lepisosteus oculatus]|uniref:Zinc fingers and homeoboxes protein 2 n=1 Tax=Lepisosteus oculatus TaxID=7918 RepID=W5NP81_LEPOC|nr:PREDICTED: zinc fingers and homeoboxes protein 2 [Lepisosteus oculatus]XP_015213364.1 PREDICTED: zinc fingers and homeoboxes protein 2 [Lepisosteus oculatus]XP_015213365.1 PREDICTED: zinc fingers and homeoboxes protein 2 [Lepisosteus oculatus]XP_015213366.1 PREDICTED: zinc fingers and homeoboxes protein 2 [Lepisosteus oculatus]
MASRRKSTIPCMIRASEMLEQDEPDEMEETRNGTVENGSPQKLGNDNWTLGKEPVNAEREMEQETLGADTRQQCKSQGGYECKYCPYSTQNLNEFKEHVDSNHPNVILNPLYVCAECNFNTKKFDTLSEHNEKCHPGEINFKFKRIKQNNQTILEQTIEVNYDSAAPRGTEDPATFPMNKSTVKAGKPKMDSKRLFRKGDELENLTDRLTAELAKEPITAVNVNGTVIIPESTIKEGLSHVMPSLQRPPNFNLVPKIAVPLNTTKYNPSLDANMTLITSFNKFPYPTQAELSWLTAASKHPEEQIKVWFTTQRLKQGISWSPEEVEEARKKMFNGTIQPISQTFTVFPAHLTQPTKVTQPLIQTVPCQLLGQTSLVLTQVANGSTMTCAPIALTVANHIHAPKRPLAAPVVAPEVKRPNVIQTIQTPPRAVSPIPSLSFDRKKSKEQIAELKSSFLKSQFPEDKEVYRLIEATSLSRSEIKKWFSDHRYRNQKGLPYGNSESLVMAHDSSQPQSSLVDIVQQRFKGKTSDQLKILEDSFRKTSFPTQGEIDHLMMDTSLSRKEIDSWFVERRTLRDNLEQALLNSMGSGEVEEPKQQQGELNGVHQPEAWAGGSPLSTVAPTQSPMPLDKKSLNLLKDVFARTQWPSPEEYNQLELQTGLARTEIVRWFKDNRSALKSGSLQWMEQFQKLNGEGQNGQNQNPPSRADHAQSTLQQYYQEFRTLREEDIEKLAEQSKLSHKEVQDWFANKQEPKTFEANKSGSQDNREREDHGKWMEMAAGVDDDEVDLNEEEDVISDSTEAAYEMVEDDSEGATT